MKISILFAARLLLSLAFAITLATAAHAFVSNDQSAFNGCRKDANGLTRVEL